VVSAPATPAQHYLWAEQCLAAAEKVNSETVYASAEATLLVACAQVHATLAATTGSYADAYDRWCTEQEKGQ
jgi:hypothetical protein